MNEQTQTLVKELAAQFGTTAEHLWGVLVKQALLTGIGNSFAFCALLVIALSGFVYIKVNTVEFDKKGDTEGFYFLWGLMAFIAAIIMLKLGKEAVTCFINPEYWALQQLLQ